MPFLDRTDAGQRLASALGDLRGADAVVLALPRGGVPVAAEIADRLGAPLDLVLVRKVGVPGHEELAMGAVADGGAPAVVRNEAVIRQAGVDETTFRHLSEEALDEIERRRQRYLGSRRRVEVAGRVAIVVDDGVATGATTRAALRAVRRQRPRQLVLAVPVAPTDTLSSLEDEADRVVCLETHRDFYAVGVYYQDFAQTSDEEVVAALQRHPDSDAVPDRGDA